MLERRLALLAALAALWSAGIFYKLISLQVAGHGRFAATARRNQARERDIQAPRGAILDRQGQPLALSVPAHSIFINPLQVDINNAADLLSRALDLDQTELRGRIQAAFDAHRGHLWIKRGIPDQEWQALRALPVDYVHDQIESRRHYPNATLAAHVLGSVDFEEKGNAGIESAAEEELRGIPGEVRVYADVKNRGFDSEIRKEAKPGTPLTLSIDSRIQFVAQRELAAAAQEHGAPTGSVVVMKPGTGEILALASYPEFDPNEALKKGAVPVARRNNALQARFEPGSVFKVITVAAALETTRLTPETIINCTPTITLFKRTIHEAHDRGYGARTVREVLEKSSNIGAIRIGLDVGQENMYEYVRRFGFGSKTEVGLPGETEGRIRPLTKWGATSLASIAMGHEVGVTTVQLARAASVVANGGLLVKPRLVLKRGGQAVPVEPPKRVIKPETAFKLRQMMEGVVLEGTGKRAKLLEEGYSAGGKTGSAVIYDYAAKRYTHTYNSSFMGFAPATNPAIVVVVTLNGTHGDSGFGGAAAAPVFRGVAAEALRIMDVPKDAPEGIPHSRTMVAKAASEDVPPTDDGGDPLNLADDAPEETSQPAAPGPKVPNFRGKTMRAVMAEAGAKRIKVLADGSGVARTQAPPAGSPLQPGTAVRVVFTR
jgi:cell division protein FtsI (penicillin-binding protein 3)